MLIRLATELQFPNQFKISFHRDWVVSQKGKDEKKIKSVSDASSTESTQDQHGRDSNRRPYYCQA